jgi:hypothetical protein
MARGQPGGNGIQESFRSIAGQYHGSFRQCCDNEGTTNQEHRFQGASVMNIRHLHILLGLVAVVVLSGTAFGQFERLPTTKPGPDAATVIGSPGERARDLYEVRFVAIDGRQINPRQTLWLEPGTYELTVSIRADFAGGSPAAPRRRSTPGYNTIELELEPGKKYYVLARYNRSGEDRGAYSVILHRITE